MKQCSRCGEILPLSNYNKHNGTKDGLRKKCRDCRNLEMRNYRHTGKTFVNEFDNKQISVLDCTFENLREAYKNRGYKLTKSLIR